MLEQLKNLVKDEEAPTAVEYGLMVAAIAAAILLTVSTLGDNVNNKFKTVSDEIAK